MLSLKSLLHDTQNDYNRISDHVGIASLNARPNPEDW